MKRTTALLIIALAIAMVACDRNDALGPPAIRLGEDVCVECNMIISDRRWATATIVQGSRGPQARLFDDFNCQANYELGHGEESILARWSHDHASGQWIRTEAANFLITDTMRTPMGSRMAAFRDLSEAMDAKTQTPGEVADFLTAWKHLGHADPWKPEGELSNGKPDGG